MIGRLTGGPHADYAVVIIMAVFVFASLSWIVSARKWFKGPVRTVEDGGTPGEYGSEKTGTRVDEREASVESR